MRPDRTYFLRSIAGRSSGEHCVHTYDPLNMMKHLQSTTDQARVFLYDADDERVMTFDCALVECDTQTSHLTTTIRGIDGKVLRVYNLDFGEPWNWVRDYVYRGGQLLAAVEAEDTLGEVTRHFHLDHLGSPRQITDEGAVEVAFHTFYPFGGEATDPGLLNRHLRSLRMKVSHRAKKNLHGLYGFEIPSPGDGESWARRLGLLSSDEICGLYRNQPDCDTELIVVALDGIYIKSDDKWDFLSYGEIQSIGAPSKGPEDRALLISLNSGSQLRLPVTGGRGKLKDVYGFISFLRWASGDQR
jgi:hypothetical protein